MRTKFEQKRTLTLVESKLNRISAVPSLIYIYVNDEVARPASQASPTAAAELPTVREVVNRPNIPPTRFPACRHAGYSPMRHVCPNNLPE